MRLNRLALPLFPEPTSSSEYAQFPHPYAWTVMSATRLLSCRSTLTRPSALWSDRTRRRGLMSGSQLRDGCVRLEVFALAQLLAAELPVQAWIIPPERRLCPDRPTGAVPVPVLAPFSDEGRVARDEQQRGESESPGSVSRFRIGRRYSGNRLRCPASGGVPMGWGLISQCERHGPRCCGDRAHARQSGAANAISSEKGL